MARSPARPPLSPTRRPISGAAVAPTRPARSPPPAAKGTRPASFTGFLTTSSAPSSSPHTGSPEILTGALRRLEYGGLVSRQSYAESPPRVEHGLAPLGRTLPDAIEAFGAWAFDHGDEVMAAPEHADRPTGEATRGHAANAPYMYGC
ncbi:winged helix-turn-helix transcriptional regulator [Streptomyces sp. NPDC058257]|uniref:winged helix-turn-helix transcriptional regulator n=1 Tax=Streptomyces sp. NPDC058257 TaxID=3346409 RepID=UPI0036E5FEB2